MREEWAKDNPEAAKRMEEMKARQEARKAEMLKKFDKDGDGKLSDEEKKAMREEWAKEHPEAAKRMGDMKDRGPRGPRGPEAGDRGRGPRGRWRTARAARVAPLGSSPSPQGSGRTPGR